jgi:flagellar hook-basal body complex protein FliE
MNITSIGRLTDINQYGTNSVSTASGNRNATFEDLFQAAVKMVNQTNDYTNAAEEAEISYALGLMDNPLELQVAQYKANMSLQYTVSVRNAALDAYKEIMNLQF